MYLVIYVDDMLIIYNDEKKSTNLKNNHFQTKNLDVLIYFLGIEVLMNPDKVRFTKKVCSYIPEETWMKNRRPINTLMDPKREPNSDCGRCRKLKWVIVTRPNIGFPVSVVSQ